MQIGMKEAITKDHINDGANTQVKHPAPLCRRQRRGRLDARLSPREVLHTQHIMVAERTVDPGEADIGLVAEVGSENLGIVRFVAQIDLTQRVAGELVDQLFRLIASQEELEKPAQQAQKLGVSLDGLAHAWLEHLEHHFVAVMQARPVALRE